jgi:hypothetical protein
MKSNFNKIYTLTFRSDIDVQNNNSTRFKRMEKQT